MTAPLPLAPPQAVCEWRVGALLRGGDVLSPNRSVLRRWGNSMTARTFGAWRKYVKEVAREKVSTAELTMRRWLQWRVSRALQRWLDGVTFLSEQQPPGGFNAQSDCGVSAGGSIMWLHEAVEAVFELPQASHTNSK